MRRRRAVALCSCLLAGCAVAKPATVEASWRDLDGNEQRPLACGTSRAVVLIFIQADCPIANGYQPEIRSIVQEHAHDPIQFYQVHVETDLDAERARQHARDYGIACPVLLDPEHRLVARAGATVTPEAAVLLGNGEIAYRGRIDNWYADLGQKRRAPTTHDLRDAIAAVLAGSPVAQPRTQAVGCDIVR